MIVLGVETTCDETGVAILEDGFRIRANIVNSQIPLHERFGGVVPEIASRAHAEVVTRLIERALVEADLSINDPKPPVDAIAVANRPGLIGALLVGVTAAKALSLAWDVPLIGVDHVHAHIHSVMLSLSNPPETAPREEDYFPAISLVVSGGHTTLYASRSATDHEILGNTTDDAAGEAFDKVAALLGLGYPGGPAISSAAEKGDRQSTRFPRTLLGKDSLDFSFSGLKTAVRYYSKGQDAPRTAPIRPGLKVEDVAAAFEAAAVDVLVEKLRRAMKQRGMQRAIVCGGVAANRYLRSELESFAKAEGVAVHFPELKLCTDNAAMIAGLGHALAARGTRHNLSLKASTMTSP